MTVILKDMGSTVQRISAGLKFKDSYDAAEITILTDFEGALEAARQAWAQAPLGDEAAPESARTVLAQNTPTIVRAA